MIPEIAREIFESLRPENSFHRFFARESINLSGSHLIGLGKPAAFYVQALLKYFDFKSTLAIVKRGHETKANFLQWQHDHPLVTDNNLSQSKQLKKYLENIDEKDQVCFLVTGGASAMLSDPNMPQELFNTIWKQMLYEGWAIEDMNKIRIIMDSIKGGGLLNSLRGQSVKNLYVSDVPLEPFSHVSSSPTNPVHLKFQDVVKLIQRFSNSEVRDVLKKCLNDYSTVQYSVENYLVESAQDLIEIASEVLKKSYPQYKIIRDDTMRSESHFEFVERIPRLESQSIFLSVGEAGVDAKNSKGVGGRNSHLAATMQSRLQKGQSFFSLASDGNDGNTKFAGGWAEYQENAPTDLKSSLDQFNSAQWLEHNSQVFDFGPSHTNLMDLRVFIQHI